MTPERIKKIRTELGISQEAMAHLIGVSSVVTVHRWEAGKTPVQFLHVEIYEELERALKAGVPPSRILEIDRKSHRRLRFFCRVHAAAGLEEN